MRVKSSNNVCELQCQYERGGWCKQHKAKGTRCMRVTKVWDQLKSGLFGYKVKKKVTYKCAKKVFDGNADLPSTAMDELGSEGQQVGHSGNFTVLLRAKKLPGQKRFGDSFLETWTDRKKVRLELTIMYY